MKADVTDVLSPVHVFPGCETTSKIVTKTVAFKIANKCGYELLCFFVGKIEITDEIILNAEILLSKCISNLNLDKFDDLKFELYYKKLYHFDLEKFPSTSSSIRQQMLWTYLQCHLWLNAPFKEDISRDPPEYGYIFNDEDHLAPIVKPHLALPSDFPSLRKLQVCTDLSMPNQTDCLWLILQV